MQHGSDRKGQGWIRLSPVRIKSDPSKPGATSFHPAKRNLPKSAASLALAKDSHTANNAEPGMRWRWMEIKEKITNLRNRNIHLQLSSSSDDDDHDDD